MQQKFINYTHFIILLILFSLLSCKSDKNSTNALAIETDKAAEEWLKDYKAPENKWGYIDTKGNLVIKDIYYDTRNFNNGIAIVNLGGKWGYIDQEGNEIIGPQYLDAHNFVDNIALVQNFSKQYFFINKEGKKLFDCPGKECTDFIDGFSIFSRDGACGIINTKGEQTCKLLYQEITTIRKNIFVANRGNKYGIIDTQGKWLLQPNYDKIKEAGQNYLLAKKDNKYFYLNDNYEEVLGPYDEASVFQNEHAAVTKGNTNIIIDKTGKELYKSSNPIMAGGENKWHELQGEKTVFIDEKGKNIYNKSFDSAYKFHSGIAAVQVENAWGYIDTLGNFVIKPALPIVCESFENRVRFIANTGYGFLDNQGKLIIAPKYIEARDFNEGMARVQLR